MIEVKYRGWTFTGSGDNLLLLSPTSPPNVYEAWAPISLGLEWDTLTFGVKSVANGEKKLMTVLLEWYTTVNNEGYVVDDGDLMDYTIGEPVQVYKDGSFWREFYLSGITRRRGDMYEFSCVSAVGLLAQMEHRGDIYFGATTGEVIADIMGAIPYSIDADVAAVTLYGWLPSSNARDNLSRVLFATGASLLKSPNGGVWFTFNQPTSSTDVSSRTFYEMSESEIERYGKVRVIEHTFFNSSHQTEQVLYDNTAGVAADAALIRFDEPMASLDATGLTVLSSGTNWAIISGTGVLYGTPYVHVKRVIEESTGLPDSDELEIADNALIGRLNSPSVMERLINYYGNATQYSISIKQEGEKTGGLITYPTMNGDTAKGYIKTMDSRASSFVRSDIEVISNWTPTGLGNTYSEYFLITTASGGRITIPTAHRGKKALAVLFGGAQGGYGGHDGDRGGNGAPYSENIISRGYGGQGGQGGAGSQGGGGGRYLQVEIDSLAASYTGSIGEGGAGGASVFFDEEPNAGEYGGDTVLGDYSTADGVVLEGPYINMIDGSIYGEEGQWGYDGEDGGAAGDLLESKKKGEDGQDGNDFNSVWTGGKGGLGVRSGTLRASGGGGGGAAYGASAEDCTQRTDTFNRATAGADAVAPAQAEFYRGGTGGNGGGGGGGSVYRYNEVTANYNNGGRGGWGSDGGQGADGFILFYV